MHFYDDIMNHMPENTGIIKDKGTGWLEPINDQVYFVNLETKPEYTSLNNAKI